MAVYPSLLIAAEHHGNDRKRIRQGAGAKIKTVLYLTWKKLLEKFPVKGKLFITRISTRADTVGAMLLQRNRGGKWIPGACESSPVVGQNFPGHEKIWLGLGGFRFYTSLLLLQYCPGDEATFLIVIQRKWIHGIKIFRPICKCWEMERVGLAGGGPGTHPASGVLNCPWVMGDFSTGLQDKLSKNSEWCMGIKQYKYRE